jgi:hypothetical protein
MVEKCQLLFPFFQFLFKNQTFDQVAYIFAFYGATISHCFQKLFNILRQKFEGVLKALWQICQRVLASRGKWSID